MIQFKDTKKNVERIFGVSLKNRVWEIRTDNKQVELIFCDKDSIFGWVNRISAEEYLNRKNNVKTCR